MNEERFALLAERYLAGALSEAEERELAEALERDRGARERFLGQVRLSVALSGHLNGHAQEDAEALSSQVLNAASASGRLKSLNRIGKRLGLPFAEGTSAHQGHATQAENASPSEVSEEEPDIKFATGIQKFVKERKSSKRIRKGSVRRARIASRMASRRRAAFWPWLPVLAAACALVGVTLYLTVFRRDSDRIAQSPESIGQVVWVRELTRDEFAPVLVRTVNGKTAELELKAEEQLYPGDQLKTKGQASDTPAARAAIRMRDGTEVDLADATTLKVSTPAEVELKAGHIYVEAPGAFRIKAEMADVEVDEARESEFEMSVDEREAILRVGAGRVTFANAHARREVSALRQSVARKGSAPSLPAPLGIAALWRGRKEPLAARQLAGPTPSALPEMSVASFTLIDANTNRPIAGFDPLTDGAVLDLSKLPTKNLNIRANTVPSRVGCVQFELDGNPHARIEAGITAPIYSLAGDREGDYAAWTPEPGWHTLTATPHSDVTGNKQPAGTAGKGLTIRFRVVDK